MKTKMFVFGFSLFSIFLLSLLFLNLNEIREVSYEKFLNSLSHNQSGDRLIEHDNGYTYPLEASISEYIKTVDPSLRYVPKDRLRKAYQNKSKYKNSNNDALLWENVPCNLGGRTRAIMWDPTDSANNYKKAFAGATTGGLWVNNDVTNADSDWEPVEGLWAGLSISTIVYDPNELNTFYLGTGEAHTAVPKYRESSGVGYGIWKSTDAGETWQVIESTIDFKYITDIKIRNVNGQSEIYAGVASGNYKGIDHLSEPSDGLFKSTDGGETWQQVLPDIPGESITFTPNDIEIASNNRIYVGTMRFNETIGGGYLLYSDDGDNWTIVDDFLDVIANTTNFNIPGRIEIASAPSNPNKIYALVTSGADYGVYIIGRCFNILRSEDGGDTWTSCNLPSDYPEPGTGTSWAYIAWHALTAAVDPNDENTIIVGSVDLHKSVDGGNTWNYISSTQAFNDPDANDTTFVHADQHEILYKFNSSSEILFTTDGGIFYSNTGDRGFPYFEMRNKSYSTLQCYTCAIHPELGRGFYMAGQQDNSTVLYNDSPIDRGSILLFGDGAYCFIDEDNPQQQIISMQWNLYGFSNDEMQTYSETMDFYPSGLFVSPADYEHEMNILFSNAGMQGGYLSDTLLKVTNMYSDIAGEFIKLGTDSRTPFSAVTISPFSPQGKVTLFLGNQAGSIYKIKQANTDPIEYKLDKGDLPIANISCIQIGNNGDHLLVTFSNYGVESVWETKDGGANWRNIEGNLPDIPVRWAIFHPFDTKKVMLATELGIYTSSDISQDNVEWVLDNQGMGEVRIDQLRVRKSDHTVLAATHGRGLYTTRFFPLPPGVGISENETEKQAYVYPNPVEDYINFMNLDVSTDAKYEIFNGKGQLIGSGEIIDNKLSTDNLKPGIYFLSVHSAELKKTFKIIKH